MRFLADAGISPRTVEALRISGRDALHVRDLGMSRATDSQILDRARTEERVVLTFDLDFGDLMALGMHASPSVIIFRLSDQTPGSVNRRLLPIVAEQEGLIARGVLILVEDQRYRIRHLPISY